MNREIIEKIIHEFYDIAKSDIMIGYHFRHIHNFDEHLERIIEFWCIQFGLSAKSLTFNLKQSHDYLKIKSAELNRWVLLFREVLNKNLSKENQVEWLHKVEKIKAVLLTLC